MSASGRELPASRHDLDTYWGRVKQAADISDPRTLFVSSARLANAQAMLAAYRDGRLAGAMTPELWQAKKIVDATLHPDRHGRAGVPALPHVVLRTVEPGRDSRHADAGAGDRRHGAVAGREPVAERGHQPRQREQVGAAGDRHAGAVVPAGRDGVVLGGRRAAGGGAAAAWADRQHAAGARAAGAVRRGGDGRRAERVPDARRGDAAWHRCVPSGDGRVPGPQPARGAAGGGRDGRQPRAQRHAHHGAAAAAAGLIFATSVLALPLALGAFPQRQAVRADSLEREFWGRGGRDGRVEFNRGI
ncbi:Sideroflexin FSF1 [Ophidiomyces ophidiicola]|nr:Sideroflexin FSF1 [Ophidiomyces ophidiicola]KAI2095657.1 Sideroflexin FSF1 [Ophidiomyces ophidiicola]KAI2109743.1 Sideroflexin FSF1 [Ophidiomyces ophidiicola]KAI2113387.1 Sideroflexin FSF1 [Ophidiomyces ophidiicola]KAI2153337.1 Sideroflexin FSF1 [Ophidiomyces ophidiicola]